MQKTYLNINILSSGQELTTKETTSVKFICSDTNVDDFEKLSFPSAVLTRIKNSFFEKETDFISIFGEEQTIVVVIPNKELENFRLAGANLYSKLTKLKIKNISIIDNSTGQNERYAFLEGLILSSYDFDKYKTKKESTPISVFVEEKWFSQRSISELQKLAKAHSFCKTLVNEPVNYMDSLKFASCVEEAGKQFGFETEILHKPQIETLKMGGLLAVNKGSITPPTFSVMTYNPANAVNKKPLVLVGKGVTFDTGGYSLKISGSMLTMKCDMAGGAAVVGILSAIALNELPYYVIGIVPATDNKISSNALVVDDVITMMDGTTVEVQNTDAEGRLVLADALHYAKRFDPELLIDMATLTGASAAITGAFGIAALGNDQQAIEELKNIGELVYERLVQLPLWKEYRELLHSSVADMSNLGGPIGGVSTAASFLKHFTDYPWIHLDIAGAAFIKEAKGYRQSGATAVPLRLIYEFVKQKCNK